MPRREPRTAPLCEVASSSDVATWTGEQRDCMRRHDVVGWAVLMAECAGRSYAALAAFSDPAIESAAEVVRRMRAMSPSAEVAVHNLVTLTLALTYVAIESWKANLLADAAVDDLLANTAMLDRLKGFRDVVLHGLGFDDSRVDAVMGAPQELVQWAFSVLREMRRYLAEFYAWWTAAGALLLEPQLPPAP